MRKSIILGILGLLLLVSVVGVTAWQFWPNKDEESKTSSNSGNNQSESDKADPVLKTIQKSESNELIINGWIPDWGYSSGLATLQENTSFIDSISPVWYYPLGNGTLEDKRPDDYSEMLDFAKENGIEVLPSIALFDHEVMTPVLQDNLDTHLESILEIVDQNDYDGLDIDYESIKLSDKEAFFDFLSRLSEAIDQRNLKLTIAVLPKWTSNIDEYKSLVETRQVQDWAAIAPLVDEIRVMTYDYTGTGSLYVGPIGPLEWQRQVLDYAKEQSPEVINKLSLGIHQYSYEKWAEVPESEENLGFEDPALKFEPNYLFNDVGTSSRSYTYKTVKRVLNDYPGETEEYQGEKIYRYSKVNDDTQIFENRILVYIDPQGIQARIDLAKEYGIKSVSFWRFGAEGDLFKEIKI